MGWVLLKRFAVMLDVGRGKADCPPDRLLRPEREMRELERRELERRCRLTLEPGGELMADVAAREGEHKGWIVPVFKLAVRRWYWRSESRYFVWSAVYKW